MTVSASPESGAVLSGGARLRFEDGHAVLKRPVEIPPRAAAALVSVVSPGTELRHMRSTISGPARNAGYMTIARHPLNGTLLLAPVPHGSWIYPGHPRALVVETVATIEAVAVARFQLIAAIGLRKLEVPMSAVDPAVIGSGPVALGCCLELVRRGAKRVRVWTHRLRMPFAGLESVDVIRSVPKDGGDLVIDATGETDRALRATARGGTVGLLGTPDVGWKADAERIHRDALTVFGMHELAGYEHADYQRTYDGVLSWLVANIASTELQTWCLRVAPAQAEAFYMSLASPGERPDQPVALLEWDR